MKPPRPAANRRWRGRAILLLVAALLASTGCVYLRLLQFQKQLASFDAYCTFRKDPGPIVGFKEPVLHPGDLAWLIELPVSQVRRDADGRSLHAWRFVPCPGDRTKGQPAGALELVLVESDGRVAEVRLPERLNHLIDEERLRRAFLGADEGRVDRGEGRTAWLLDDRLAFPLLDDLVKGLGFPCERESGGRYHVLVYRYALERRVGADGEPSVRRGATEAEAVFLYDTVRERIRGSWVRVGCLTIEVAGVPGHSYRVEIRRNPS